MTTTRTRRAADRQTDAGGHHTARGEVGDGLEVFPLVHEHDREQDQHIDRAHVYQDLGHRHETGVQQQVEPCNGHEHPAQQEGGIDDVAEQNHTQGRRPPQRRTAPGSRSARWWSRWSCVALLGLTGGLSLILGRGLGRRGEGLQHLRRQLTSPGTIGGNTVGIHLARRQIGQVHAGAARRDRW